MALTHTIEKEVKPITFQVVAKLKDGSLSKPIGTAFAISDEGHLVTALHVIELAEKHLGTGAETYFGFAGPDIDTPQLKMRANFVFERGRVIARDKDNDLAVIKLDKNALEDVRFSVGPGFAQAVPKPCKLEIARPQNGEGIAISGYPLTEPSLVTTAGTIASNWALDNGHERFLGDITANPGNSGGPVYLQKSGKVVGVCVAGKLTNTLDSLGNPADLLHSAGLTFIVPSQAIVDLQARV